MEAVNKSRLIGFRLSVFTRSLRYLPSKRAPHPLLIFCGEHTDPGQNLAAAREATRQQENPGQAMSLRFFNDETGTAISPLK